MCFLPFSKLDLLENNNRIEDLKNIQDNSISFFEYSVAKPHTVFTYNSLDRMIYVKEKVSLFQQETTYVVKAEAYKGNDLVAVNFLLTELSEAYPTSYLDLLKNYDYYSYFDNQN